MKRITDMELREKTISKACKHELIIYQKIDDERVKKCYYNKNGQKTKEKEIFVRNIHQNRRIYRNVKDFFEDVIWNHGYHEV